MDQTENNVNRRKRTKLTSKELIIATSIFVFCTVAILCCYYIFRDDYKTMAENAETYSGNAQISATEGIVSYKPDADGNITDEQMTAEDVLEGFDNIGKYLKSDTESSKEEKLTYLLNAGLVTKFPYIEDLAEDKVNGVVKFYRYSNAEDAQDPDQEKYLLEFVDEETFDQLMEAYETSGSEEVFRCFTINEDQQLVIACSSETQKEITTNDPEVTVDVINETSIDTYIYDGDKYKAGQKTITKQLKDYQSIIEQYTMPFNLLAAFLVQTGDYGFVKKLADMAYESEIHIGIYENQSVTEKSDTYTYKKRIEYSPSTELNFSTFSTSNPQMTEQTVINRFPGIIRSCIAYMPEEVEGDTWRVIHKKTNMKGEPAGSINPGELYTKYVQSYAGSKISALSDQGVNFETTYWTKTESRTSVTIGTILADTWVARWEATYVTELNEPTPGPTTSPPPDSARMTEENGASLFTGNAEKEIKAVLEEHSKNLKDAAAEAIIKGTTVSATAPTMTAEMIREHALGCDTCKLELDNFYGGRNWTNSYIISNSTLINAVKTEERLENTKKHVQDILNEEESQISAEATTAFQQDVTSGITSTPYLGVAKSYVSISLDATYDKTSVTHKQQTPERTDDGEKFKDLFNNSEFHESKRAVLDRIQWFWEYIREYDDTAKFEDILRYLFYLATGSDEFGDFSDPTKIEELFKAFEPKELMQPSTIAGLQLLRQYICAWENQTLLDYINGEIGYSDYVSQYITEDKKYYKVNDDGKEHPTVGFGIDLFNGSYYDEELGEWRMFWEVLVEDYGDEYGYTKEQLEDISGKTEIPVEIIDDLKEKRIMYDYNYVIRLADTYGLDLTNYQIYALTSRCYNSWIDENEFQEFVEVYTNYYNFETDDKYGIPYTDEDFEHGLYTEHMDEPITSEGEVLPGLISRRKSEWVLFLTGYMDNLDIYVPLSGSILEACITVMNELLDANVHYSTSYSGAYPLPNKIDIESFHGYGCCCATYVSRVLYISGVLTVEQINSVGGGINSSGYNCADTHGVEEYLRNAGWIKVSEEEAQPGDVGIWHNGGTSGSGHVFIYAGENEVWEQSSGVVSSRGNPPTRGTNSNWTEYANEHELCIYRMP